MARDGAATRHDEDDHVFEMYLVGEGKKIVPRVKLVIIGPYAASRAAPENLEGFECAWRTVHFHRATHLLRKSCHALCPVGKSAFILCFWGD